MELEDKEELKISLFFEPRYCHDVSIKLERWTRDTIYDYADNYGLFRCSIFLRLWSLFNEYVGIG